LSFRTPDQSLRDILNSIVMIEEFMGGVSLDRFRSEPMRIAAVERHLQKISEAAIRLGNDAEVLCPGLPWRNIRGIGNFLRHEYDRVDLDTVWHTVTDQSACAESFGYFCAAKADPRVLTRCEL
jgi:uncharacterized protein with HEPN domain